MQAHALDYEQYFKNQLHRVPHILVVLDKKDALPSDPALITHKSIPCSRIGAHHVLWWPSGATGAWLKLIQGICRGKSKEPMTNGEYSERPERGGIMICEYSGAFDPDDHNIADL